MQRLEMFRLFSRSLAVPAALLAISVGLAIMRLNSFPMGGFQDDAHYLILADSLAHGDGFRLINFPTTPTETDFPPGWPLVLAIPATLFPGSYRAAQFVSLACWLGTIVVLNRFYAQRLTSRWRFVVLSMVALNPILIGTAVQTMSESAYLFGSLLSIELFHCALRRESGQRAVAYLVLALVAALGTELVRVVGISLIGAMVAWLFLNRRWRLLFVALGVIPLGVVGHVLLVKDIGASLIPSGESHEVFSGGALTLVAHAATNTIAYGQGIVSVSLLPYIDVLTRHGGSSVFLVVNLLIVALVVVGFVSAVRCPRVEDIYFVLYVGTVLCFWNPASGNAQGRFLVPILPFLYLYGLTALAWTQGRLPVIFSQSRIAMTASVLAFIVVPFVASSFQDIRSPVRDRMTDLTLGTTWVARNTPASVVLLSPDPIPDSLYAHRKTVRYPATTDNLDLFLQANNVDYILIAPRLQSPRPTNLDPMTMDLQSALIAKPRSYPEVYSDAPENLSIYRVAIPH